MALSMKYLELASKNGHVNATSMIADISQWNNPHESVKYYLRAIELGGSPEIYLRLGMLFAVGRPPHLDMNYRMALKYAKLAEKGGFSNEAKKIYQIVRKAISHEKKHVDGIKSLFKCNVCGKPDQDDFKLKTCSRCKKVRYCSIKCQRKDWKNHKPNCIVKTSSSKKQSNCQEKNKKTNKQYIIIAKTNTKIDPKRELTVFYECTKQNQNGRIPPPAMDQSYFILAGLKIRKINRLDMKYLRKVFDIPSRVQYLKWGKSFECMVCNQVCKEGVIVIEVMTRTEKGTRAMRQRSFPRISHINCLEGDVEKLLGVKISKMKWVQGMNPAWDLLCPSVEEFQRLMINKVNEAMRMKSSMF